MKGARNIIVKCETCEKELIRNNSQIKASKTGLFFCDRDCKSSWHAKRFESDRKNNEEHKGKLPFECPLCHEIVMIHKHKVKNRKCCSRECFDGHKVLSNNTEVLCNWCGKEFMKINSKVRNHNFCDKDCAGKWNTAQSGNIPKNCIICHKDFSVPLSRKDTAKTCCIECHYKHISNISSGDGIMVEQLRRNGVKSVSNQKKSGTKPELMTENCLTKLGIKFETQYPMYDKFVVDFYLPDYDVVLEVYGDYWHMNPAVYGDGLTTPNEHQLKQSRKDKSKEGYLKKCGHKFVYIWEKDIYENVEKEIKEKIL